MTSTTSLRGRRSPRRCRMTGFESQMYRKRVLIEFPDRDIDETRPLQRDQFETLYRRIVESS